MDATDFATALIRLLRCNLALLLAVACAFSTAAASEFEDANRLYDQGEFAEARQKYEQLVERGEWSANLFHNLGNTDFRLGSPGRAILDYERALALEPAHPEAHRNLNLLRERTGARTPPRHWYDVLFPRWTGDVLALICAVAVWSAVFCFALPLLTRTRRPVFAWLGMLAVCVALYVGAGIWRHAQQQAFAIITSKEAVARLAPAEQSEVATTLPAGSQVHVLTQRGDWIYCRLPGEGLGWLPAGVLERVRIET